MRGYWGIAGLLLSGALGCAGPTPPGVAASEMPHLGKAWFLHRAQGLGLSDEEARARDAALPDVSPPDDIFDAALATEAALLWREHCSTCHGPEGKLRGVAPMDPEPREWGTFGARMGFFFGGDKMRAGIFKTISGGKEDLVGRKVMPAWGGLLSREQMWGLVRHIEGL